MHLADYLAERGQSHAEFAAAIGLSAEAVRLIVRGKRMPRGDTMRSIIEATSGKVQPNDFFGPGKEAAA